MEWVRERFGAGIVVAAVVCAAFAARAARAAEIVYADGRHEAVEEPRQDSKGEWTYTREGRRIGLRPGEVAAVVDDAGGETPTIPALADGENAPDVAGALASVLDRKNDGWEMALERVGRTPTRASHDAFVELTRAKDKALRARAVPALCALHTRESVLAAAAAVLAEKDRGLRRDGAWRLFSVQEIFKRSESAEVLKQGLADKDADVRYVFAVLAPPDDADAVRILRDEALKNSDHHIRETAALELGERGDASGEALLATMLTRSRLPGFDAGDEELMTRLLVTEQVAVCRAFAKLGTERGKAALEKATKSPHQAVRAAAEKALAEIAAKAR